MSNLRTTEAIRKHISGYYIGFTMTSESVCKETGFNIKEVSNVLSRLKSDKKLLKARWVPKSTGGKQIVYVKIAEINTYILPPSKTGKKSGPKSGSSYVKPDITSNLYKFIYGGILRA